MEERTPTLPSAPEEQDKNTEPLLPESAPLNQLIDDQMEPVVPLQRITKENIDVLNTQLPPELIELINNGAVLEIVDL